MKELKGSYCIRKFKEYFFPKINEDLLLDAMNILSEEEKKIFYNMSKYDRFHSLEVYKKLKMTELKNDKLYLKLALLHDCGKNKIGFILRILHKIGISTKLKNHTEIGYKKIVSINKELAILIKNHHNDKMDDRMKIFQKCDDSS